MMLATASPLSSRADDVSIPVSSLLNKDLHDVRRAFVGDLPSGDHEPMSVFETATTRIEAFYRYDLIQMPGCQAYLWPVDPSPTYDFGYSFIFANGNLRTITQIIFFNPFSAGGKTYYRGGPRPILQTGEHLPLEAGVGAYLDGLLSSASPIDKDVKMHCADGPGAVTQFLKSDDQKLLASIRVGMELDGRVFVQKHRGAASLFEGGSARYFILSIRQDEPFFARLKMGDRYDFIGIRDGRVEWKASGLFAGGVRAGICLSERNSDTPRRHCSSNGVFRP
jgi:hypothetical protein